MNVALSPDDIARACADAMWKEDDASKGLGMKIVEVKPGQATLTMTVQPHMVNGQRIAHGGFIFLLADSTFAFACNSRNERAVAAQCDITFIRPGKLGDVLLVFTEMTLSDHRYDDFSRFEAAIRNMPEIIECHLVSGGYDYLLKFVTNGVNHYQSVIESMLERNIGIEKYFSYIVIKSPFVKHHYPLERLFG